VLQRKFPYCELRDVIHSFALTEIKLYFSSLSTLDSLTLKYQTDIEVEIFEMRGVSLLAFSVYSFGQSQKKITVVARRRTDHFEGQSAVMKLGKDPLAISEDSTIKI
jgi:hypothetical protein